MHSVHMHVSCKYFEKLPEIPKAMLVPG